ARDRKVLRDYSGALSYGSTAKYLNIAGLMLNILFLILIVVLVATGALRAMAMAPH
ncbi:PREDICTED: dispanin subfamily A member 2b-like, partial [Mesitornis unicolor]|uniref:dispanin subfamily A member 2b-like n=1 Tax=Mesitornis unicolor TaxID=54374 RepID=UPI000528F3CE